MPGTQKCNTATGPGRRSSICPTAASALPRQEASLCMIWFSLSPSLSCCSSPASYPCVDASNTAPSPYLRVVRTTSPPPPDPRPYPHPARRPATPLRAPPAAALALPHRPAAPATPQTSGQGSTPAPPCAPRTPRPPPHRPPAPAPPDAPPSPPAD